MHELKSKDEIYDWYLKTVPPLWINADFECRNISVDGDSERHLRSVKDPERNPSHLNKPIEESYTKVKNPYYDSSNQEENGYRIFWRRLCSMDCKQDFRSRDFFEAIF